MTLATKNGSLIVKDGKLAENCGCCGGWYCEVPCCPEVSVKLTISSFSWTYQDGGNVREVIPSSAITAGGPHQFGPFTLGSGSLHRGFLEGKCTPLFPTESSLCYEAYGRFLPRGETPSCEQHLMIAYAAPGDGSSQCKNLVISFHGAYLDKCYDRYIALSAPSWVSETNAGRVVSGSHSSSSDAPWPYTGTVSLAFAWSLS